MKKLLLLTAVSAFLYSGLSAANNLPARTPANVKKYIKICRESIHRDMTGMFREAGDNLPYPFMAPGSQQYKDALWDWDSWMSNIVVRQILLEKGSEQESKDAIKYEQGCILNFLSFGSQDGWLPISIYKGRPVVKPKDPTTTNMHKPCLAQHAAFIVKNTDGNVEWPRDKFYHMQTFVNSYWNFHRNREANLYFWQSDNSIGVDNDPSTFYRPKRSSGSILLNTFMYKELLAMTYLAEQLNLGEIADIYRQRAEELKNSIQKYCWDEWTGFFYSVDFNLLPPDRGAEGISSHRGGPRTYPCLIQRFGVWSGFLPMWAGIATKEQAERMVNEHFKNEKTFNSPAGIRSLSKLEQMYNPMASGNPSSWLGPIWLNVQYFVWRGLVNYGYTEEARELAEKAIILCGWDFERFGALHEYYLPSNGEPVLNKGFQNWNFLVLNMAAWLEGKPYVVDF